MTDNPFGDPTMNRSGTTRRKEESPAGRSATYYATEGWFVDYGNGKYTLTTSKGGAWPQQNVRVLQGSWGFGQDGLQRAPRPWKYDGRTGATIEEGDRFLVLFYHGQPNLPVCIPGVRSTKPDDFFDSDPIGLDPNPIKARAIATDGQGNRVASFEFEAFSQPNIVEFRVFDSGDKETVRMRFDSLHRTLHLGGGNEQDRAVLGDSLLNGLSGMVEEVIAIGAASGVPTPKTLQLKADIEASLGGLGAPLLSGYVKLQ